VPAATVPDKKKKAKAAAPKAAKPPVPLPFTVDLKTAKKGPLDTAFFRSTFMDMLSMTTEADLFAVNSLKGYEFVGDAILQSQGVVRALDKKKTAAGRTAKVRLHDIVQCYVTGNGPGAILFDKLDIKGFYSAGDPLYQRFQGLTPERKADAIEAMIGWTHDTVASPEPKKLRMLHIAILRELLKEGDTICKRECSL
jgi:hypothetical protein